MASRVSSNGKSSVSTTTTSAAGDNKAMWEYEAPQYCDFSSADTFVDNDPTVDQFFLTDHDSTKENDEMASADGSLDTDIFTTPLSRPGKKSIGGGGGGNSCYKTPKSTSGSFDSEITPVAPQRPDVTGRLSTLRQTPLREIYNQGGTPLHEAGRRVAVFKRTAGGKSASKKATSAAAVVKNNNNNKDKDISRRETFDMSSVAEAIEEISTSDKENNNKVEDLMSEDEKEEEVKKVEETVLKVDEEVNFHTVDPEKELTEETAAPLDAVNDNNSSRRSSYIVKSPSIRVVHFEGKNLEALAENSPGQLQTTPLVATSSKTSLKIKARQLTPMVPLKEQEKEKPSVVSKSATVSKTTTTTGSKNPLIQGLLRNRLSKKYIKRFSKSMEEEKAKAEKAKSEGPSSSATSAAPVLKPKTTVGLSKKRVTISAPPKSTALTTTTGNNNKRGLSLKGTRRFTTAASILMQKSSAVGASKTPLKSTGNNSKTNALATNSTTTTGGNRPSPYLGLSVLNAKFMSNYCRNYTPPGTGAASAVKPKPTIPRSPNLHTSTRCTMRKHHTLGALVPAPAPKPVRKLPIISSATNLTTKPKPAAPFVPTKAVTPKFSTEARLKLWHVKHDQTDGTSGEGVKNSGTGDGGFLFKARPMPNFKRMQAAAAKAKAEAIEKGKHSVKPIEK